MGLVAIKAIFLILRLLNKNASVNYYGLIHGYLSRSKNRIKKQK